MDIIERLKQIDDYFENLSIKDFEDKLELAGINEIEPSINQGMELSLSLENLYGCGESSLYLYKEDETKNMDNHYNLYSTEYIKAV